MQNLRKLCCNKSLGLAIIRIVTGIIFVAHGWAKLTNIAGTEKFFSMIHIAPQLAGVVGILELVAGLILITGIFAKI